MFNYMDIIEFHGKDILDNDNFKSEKRFIQHGDVSVYEHSINVCVFCLKIARLIGLPIDIRSLVRGSLLHDYFLYDWHDTDKSHRLHGFTHASRALKNALSDYELNDIEKNMIFCHMFPLNFRIPKYRESVILCIADKVVATLETISPYVSILASCNEYVGW